jgi:hypothetical protein
MDPDVMVKVTGDPELGAVADEAKVKLSAALRALVATEVSA